MTRLVPEHASLRCESTDSGRLPVHLPTPERCRHSRHTACPGSVKAVLRESLHPQTGSPAPLTTKPDNPCRSALRPSYSPKWRRSITPCRRTVLPRGPGSGRMRPRLGFQSTDEQEVGMSVNDRYVEIHPDGWAVRRASTKKASSVHYTFDEAFIAGRSAVMHSGGGKLHILDESDQLLRTYIVGPTNDPFYPRCQQSAAADGASAGESAASADSGRTHPGGQPRFSR